MFEKSPDKLKRLEEIIKSEALVRKEEQPFMTSSSGKPTNWLLDLRRTMLKAEAMEYITDLFWDMYEDKYPFQVGGMEVAAVPLVTAIILKGREKGYDINGFLIRKNRKQSGLGKNIEGVVTDDPVILVDDLLNSGSSMEKSKIIVAQEDQNVREVFVIVDFQSSAGLHWREENNIEVNSIFTGEDLDLQFSQKRSTLKIEYKFVWRHYSEGAFPFHLVPKSTPLLIDNYIYMGVSAGKMLCIDRQSGEAVWEFEAKGAGGKKGIFSSPAYHSGRIYFGAYNGNVYCITADKGELVWENPACDWVGSSPLIVPGHNMLYIGLEYERLRAKGSNAAFNLDTGSRVWETPQKKFQHGSAAYWEEDDLVIFGNANHDITAYEALTGKPVWTYDTDRSIKYPPAIDKERKIVVASSFDGNIYILDVRTGEKKAAIQTNDICYSTPLIAFGKIFCGSGDKNMYIIDADSFELVEKMDFHSRIFSSPRIIDENVIFGTNGGVIVELDPETHDVVGKTQLPDAVTNAVASSEGGRYIYASTHMNELYAIRRRRRA